MQDAKFKKKRSNIIIDTDPGIDDAVAIGLAGAYQEQLKIHGIVTVSGNQTIERVTENALKLVSFLHLDVPVASGSHAPLLREVIPAEDVHGKTGLGNCELPKTDRTIVTDSGVWFTREKICGLPEGEKMTLVPIGPLTNIALLIKTFPEVCDKIEEICLMGGSTTAGNMTPTGEFNIWQDPEAAQIVFKSGIPIVMCGLNITSSTGLTQKQVHALRNSSGRVARAYGEMLDFYFHCPVYAGRELVAIHDATAIMYLVHPELFEGEKMQVEVDCSEGMNRGMTVCDSRSWIHEEGNALVLMRSDFEKFQEYLLEAIESYD